MNDKQTYWLCHNGEPYTSVRLHKGATDEAIKRHALRTLEKLPGIFSDPPFVAREIILNGEIRTQHVNKSESRNKNE